jgi:hypothetical protein
VLGSGKYPKVDISMFKAPEKYWCHDVRYQHHKRYVLNGQVYYINEVKYLKVIYIMQDVHVKLNPGFPLKKQQSTRRRFSPENLTNIEERN